jgi:hypothetical protein
MPRHPNAPPSIHDYDIRLKEQGKSVVPVLFTWYKGLCPAIAKTP